MALAFFCRPIARVDGAIYLPKQGNTNKFLNMIALLKKIGAFRGNHIYHGAGIAIFAS